MDALRELKDLAERHARPGALSVEQHADLGLRVVVARRSSRHASDLVLDRQVCVVVAGEKLVRFGERRMTARPGMHFISAAPLPVSMQLPRATPSEPFVAVSVVLEPARVAALLADAPAAPERAASLAITDSSADVLDALLRLVRLLDRPRDIPVLGPGAERELLYRLSCGAQGGQLRELARADGRSAQIARAMRRIQTHYTEPLRIGDLARLAGMSPTSFHRHFRAIAAMSPLQYQKQLRLQAARARLLAGGADIAGIGHAVGYASPAQFSRDYKRAFGTPPGRSA